jgi:hypothetical protein
LICAIAGSSLLWAGDNAKISASDLVAKHLESVGKSAEQTGAPRAFQGQVTFSEIIGRKVRVDGSASMLSQGRKFKCAFQFGTPQYPGEQWVFDGEKIMVGMIDPTSRSNLGAFLYSQEEILREGLLGGTLSSAWPLSDLAARGATLKYKGLRKIDGRELHDAIYAPKNRSGSGELTIHLYFEPETYRHVMTVYTVTLRNGIASAKDGSDETERQVEERFDDFRLTDGRMLPWHWTVRLRQKPQTRAQEYQWEARFTDFRVLAAN